MALGGSVPTGSRESILIHFPDILIECVKESCVLCDGMMGNDQPNHANIHQAPQGELVTTMYLKLLRGLGEPLAADLLVPAA